MTEAIVAGLFGLLIGSFLSVCIYRLPLDLSVVAPRSYCPRCEKTIAWYDNVPLVSYIVLRGRCRHCGGRISARYPLVELLTGAAFFFAVLIDGLSLEAVKAAVFCAITIELSVSDVATRILPDEFTLGGAALGVILAVWIPMPAGIIYVVGGAAMNPTLLSVAESVAGAICTSGALYLVGWLYQKIRHREGLGLGDVKMIAMIGAFLGIHHTLVVMIVGSLAGSVIGLLVIYILRKDPATYELPFGTFLGGAGVLFVLFGQQLLGY